jgi:hypothetical protein
MSQTNFNHKGLLPYVIVVNDLTTGCVSMTFAATFDNAIIEMYRVCEELSVEVTNANDLTNVLRTAGGINDAYLVELVDLTPSATTSLPDDAYDGFNNL